MDPLTRNILLAGATEQQNGPPTIDILGIGGGGGGGGQNQSISNNNGNGGGGGGGGGEVRLDSNVLLTGRTLTITVGAGGTGGLGDDVDPINGTNGGTTSVAIGGSTVVEYIGGGAGGWSIGGDGVDGACGGGGGGGTQAATRGDAGLATVSLGFDGGGGHGSSSSTRLNGGGGGGFGGAGGSASSSVAGAGGAGVAVDLNGKTYSGGAGGGGSASSNGSSGEPIVPDGAHGAGGFIAGVRYGGSLNNVNNGPAVANSGSGGSGWQFTQSNVSGSPDGSAGILVISYLAYFDEAVSTTGTVTHTIENGYHFYEFTGDGTITLPNYSVTGWAKTIDIMAVGGGGAGGGDARSGGGGAGAAAFLEGYPTPLGEITVTVGAGGTDVTGTSSDGVNGGDTIFETILDGPRTFPGGGSAEHSYGDGSQGGCGAGAGIYYQLSTVSYSGGPGEVGFDGGDGYGNPTYGNWPGGGGGMGSAGQSGTDAVNAAGGLGNLYLGNGRGADGGDGVDYTINGRVYSVAAGGGAGRDGTGVVGTTGSPGLGGSTPLGGIIGGYYDETNSQFVDPLTNSGSGGAGGEGASTPSSETAVHGADGIVVFSYPDSLGDPLSVTGTFNLVTTGGFRYYEFTGNGTIKFTELPSDVPAPEVGVLLVGGGGGGGSHSTYSSGGGAGGRTDIDTNLSVVGGATYTVTVGAGGAGGSSSGAPNDGSAGEDSTFSGPNITTLTGFGGGGGGGSSTPSVTTGQNGGGAGGFKNNQVSGATGAVYDGGRYEYLKSGNDAGGGGAGDNGDGSNANDQLGGGNGGPGSTLSLFGQNYTLGGGGAGGSGENLDNPQPSYNVGGTGGGGDGQYITNTPSLNTTILPTNGVDGTGGGGGGGSYHQTTHAQSLDQSGGDGGDGLVVIAYPEDFRPAITTGTVTATIAGGYRYYTFSSDGTISF